MRYMILLASTVALGAGLASPAMADVVQVSASAIQGYNVLFNAGTQTATTVNGHLNNSTSTAVNFTGASGATLIASGGQASISGALDLSTQNPNDTIPLNGLSFSLANNATFNNVEFNLFGGSATSVNFTVVDNSGRNFTFSNALGNGENFFGLQAINGQSIRSVAFATVGGGINDVRQVRLGLTSAAVPEPAIWAMMVGGFGFMGAAMRRRQRAAVRYA